MTILCSSRCLNGTILGLGHGDCVVDSLEGSIDCDIGSWHQERVILNSNRLTALNSVGQGLDLIASCGINGNGYLLTILCCSRCFNGTILGLGHGDCVVDSLVVVDSVGLHSVEVIADNGNNYFVAIAGLNNFLYKVSMLADESGINVAVGDSLAVSKLEVVLIHILCEALKGSALNGDASDSCVINQGDVVDVEYVSFSATARCGVG